MDVNEIDKGYQVTLFLPIIFWICFYLFLWNPVIKLKSPFIVLYSIIAFIRYVVLSISTVYNGNYIGISQVQPSTENLNFAAILMCWELIITTICIRHWSRINSKIEKNKKLTSGANLNIYALFIVISVAMMRVIPKARYGLSFFSNISRSVNEEVGSILILGIRECFINSKYFFLFIIIIMISGRNNENLNKNRLIKYIFIFLAAILIIGLRIGTNRKKMIADSLAVMLLICTLFPKYRKVTTIAIALVAIILFAVTTIFREMTSSIGSLFNDYFSLDVLQPYFLGQYNIAISIESLEMYSYMIDLKTYFFSFLRPIFGIGSFIKHIEFIRVAELFNLRMSMGLSNVRVDQILPMISEGYMLFGFILSPLLSLITARIGVLFDSIYLKSEKLEIVFISSLGSFYLAQGMILNATIILNVLTYSLAIYIPIVYLGYKIKRKPKLRYQRNTFNS